MDVSRTAAHELSYGNNSSLIAGLVHSQGSCVYVECVEKPIHSLKHWVRLNCVGEEQREFPQPSRFSLLPLECAKVFYAAGAKLVLCGRNREALEELTKELTASQVTKVSPGACFPWGRGTVHPLLS